MKWLKKVLAILMKGKILSSLPQKNGILDLKLIERIWILTDNNGRSILVVAEGKKGEVFYETYTPYLNSLIIGSGIPFKLEKASIIFGKYALAVRFTEESYALEKNPKIGPESSLG